MALSKIEWTDFTWNWWNGCTAVAPECDNCYAEARDERFGGGVAPHFGAGKERQLHSRQVRYAPQKWNREPFYECAGCRWRGTERSMEQWDDSFGAFASCPECHGGTFKQVRPRVFAQSLADTFDNEVPQAWRDEMFQLMEQCSNLVFLLLTKRIGNVWKMVPAHWLEPGGWPQHVRLGVTAGTQKAADRDIPQLLALNVPNFVSMEPLLEHVVLREEWLYRDWPNCDRGFQQGIMLQEGYCCRCFGHRDDPIHTNPHRILEWVIDGGESGRGPAIRPTHPGWYRSLRDQCEEAGVPYLHKQNGEWVSVSEVAGIGNHYHFEDGATVRRVGKEKAGRTLDGRTHDGFPAVAA